MKKFSYALTISLPLIALVLTSIIILVMIETRLLANTQAFAQNITLAHRNLTLIVRPVSLRKIDSNSTPPDLKRLDSPLSLVETMRNGVNSNLSSQRLSTSGSANVNKNGSIVSSNSGNNNTYYTFSEDKRELSTPGNNIHTGEFGTGIRIALVNPTFTTAAYNHAFYVFYKKYANTRPDVNVTTDLKLLSSKVINTSTSLTSPSARSAFAMLNLLNNLKWLTQDSNITVLSDAAVDNGSIFDKNAKDRNMFDVIILGHQEYVTQEEYNNLKEFVSNGGTMIILDGNVFFAQVKYDRNNQNVTLVKGHGWTFNGKSAWKSINERWKSETSQWVGSNYLCYKCVSRFVNDPFGYKPHEEQYVTNPKDIVLLNYNASVPEYLFHKKPVIASYELNYKLGRVIALGIYSDDIISNGKFQRYLDSLLLQYDIKITD